MSFTSPSFTKVSLGTERNAISIQLLEFPKFDIPLLDKVQAFVYFEEIIQQYCPQLSSVSVQLTYANNIPVSSTAAASKEANCAGCDLYSSLFHVGRLSCFGFHNSTSTKVDITANPTTIAFVNLGATIDPVTFSSDLHTIQPFILPYYLKLPQTITTLSPPSSTPTPSHPLQPKPLQTTQPPLPP
jgi:hypothetical protein